MALRDAFKGVWDILKWWTNVVSNTAVSWLQAVKWTARMGIKAALLWFFPVASLWYYGITRALQHIPRWVGDKYKAIHEKTLWRLENVLSFSGGAKDIKNAFVGGNNDIFDIESNGGDGSTKVARIQAKSEIEKAKFQHISEIEKLKMAEQSKNADRKHEITKLDKGNKKELTLNSNKNAHDLAITQAAHATTRHGVEQATEQQRIAITGKVDEKRIDSWDRRFEATETRATKEFEANQKVEEKKLDTEAEKYKIEQEKATKEFEANQVLAQHRLTVNKERYIAKLENEKNKWKKEDIDPALWAQYEADVQRNITESEDMIDNNAATNILEDQTKILSKQIGFLEAIRDDQKDAVIRNQIHTTIKSLQSEVTKLESEVKTRNKSLSLPTTINLKNEQKTIKDLKDIVDSYDDKTNKKIIEDQISETYTKVKLIDYLQKMTNDTIETKKLNDMKDILESIIKKLNGLNKKPIELGKDRMETLEEEKKKLIHSLDKHLATDKSNINKQLMREHINHAIHHQWIINWMKWQASDTEKPELQKWINELSDKITKAENKLP